MTSHCGYIALVGRPNVGKSTLLNRILQQKISITSRKPQTTRHSILGIRTEGEDQFIYVDTPGIHQGVSKTINRMMNKTAIGVLRDVDAIVFLIDGIHWKEEDQSVLELIKNVKVPCFLVINKVDKIIDKAILLPRLQTLSQLHDFTAILPLSAKTGTGVDSLQHQLKTVLPEGPHLFGDDQLTDRPTRFLCAELIREKIFRLCGQELPYSTTVDIEMFRDEESLVRIHALILVDKENHKRMIIGDKGSKLKDIASSARLDMEKLLGKKVFLRCWCKVKPGWLDDERLLKQLGYDH
ncbi:GTPase Era [Legionella oakridgensis]|uniref:GTPase Era n=2 Tax=Legionella oakridgensis TaxID=29423 RepID=W0B855_9GAMM|nr:GTPase Era [Legionella oakridgensis]AHE66728.1 GTP-binding protein Era [Legionella oakridgensis ATCC 33761 = DSM 21215]ETO93595.1 GTP-binding protein Era [Legionella oakridgensis RV-2-2007]KTD38100.1 GTP-binding protein Era [Legionella oakridgensis]STY19860.1 GTP-binding protein Era [Legionella longbeachae]